MKSSAHSNNNNNSSYNRGLMTGFAFSFIALVLLNQLYAMFRTHNTHNSHDMPDMNHRTDLSEASTLASWRPHSYQLSSHLSDAPVAVGDQSSSLPSLSAIDTSTSPITARPLRPRSPGDHQRWTSKQPEVATQVSISDVNDSAKHSKSPPEDPSESRGGVLTSLFSGLVSSSSSKAPLTKPQCQALYGKRRYLSQQEARNPPMLYTFPGSGNTWGRLLIEYATGVYSGSVYNDRTLLETLPGEFTCNHRVSVIKIHPHTHDFSGLYSGNFHSDNHKCQRGNVANFRRAVLLIRNPFDSIWSEYQRRVTQSHVEGVLRDGFDWSRWQANAAALSHRYAEMWSQHYHGIEQHFNSRDILYLKYEDLKDKNTRIKTLAKVVAFLGLNRAQEEQLACAFTLAENDKAHRSIDVSMEMTKQDAYLEPIACRMWALFGTHALRHGYRPWANYSCEGYPKMPRINVGPQGEYNRRWIGPGEKAIDFRNVKSSSQENTQEQQQQQQQHGNAHSHDEVRVLQQQRRHAKRPEASRVRDLAQRARGMSLDEAMSVRGIAKIGHDNPAWQ